MKAWHQTLFCVCASFTGYCQNAYIPGTSTVNSGNGNMGIGTSVPTAKFHVQQTDGNWWDGLRLSYSGKTWDIVSDTGGDRLLISKNQDGNSGITIYNGKIGLGTTNPQAKLVVQGEVHVNNTYPYIQFNSTYWGGAYSFIQNGVTNAGAGGGNYLLFYNPPSKAFNFSQGGYDALTIASNGKVGIGTLTPGYRFEVNSPSSSATMRLTSSGSVPATPTVDIYDVANQSEFIISASAGKIDLFAYSNHALSLGANNTEHVRIFPNGNVGIGTVDPKGYKLAVNGKVISEEIVVKLNSAWPDYVFDTDYPLMSLNDTKFFINQHKHLPGVPSENEVKERGISVGEMNAILLKKVEELTLHLIETRKIVDDQSREIQNLKNK